LDPTDFAEAVRQRAILDEYIKRQAVGRGGQLATVPMAFGNPFQRGWKNYVNYVDDFNRTVTPKVAGFAKAYGPLAVLVDAGLDEFGQKKLLTQVFSMEIYQSILH